MTIAVIAANGRSGSAFVEAALKAGHKVRAGVRRHSNLADHPNLEVLKCDATNPQEVNELIKGSDVVISFIGHVRGSEADVQSRAIQNIIDVMKNLNIQRVISLTGTGVRFPGDKITLIDRFLNFGISIVDPKRINDGKKHVEILKNSSLDWTILRVLKLQNIKPKTFKLTESGPTKTLVGRREVALAVLQIVEESSFVRKAPMLSKI